MRQQLRHHIWILLAGAVVCFTYLGSTRLWDKDETIYASCAREMLANDDWVVPVFNGHLFPDKPPLMYWLMISGFQAFGMTEFAARFWSAVMGIGTAIATYHLGRLLFRAEVGFWAALVVLSNLLFVISARAATVDSALTLTATLAVLLFVIGTGPGRWRGVGSEPNWLSDPGGRADRWGSWPAFAVMYAVLGVAVLAKGPIGLLLPGATLALFMLIVGRSDPLAEVVGSRSAERSWSDWLTTAWRTVSPGNVWRAVWRLRPITAVVVVLIVAAPWFVLVGIRTEGLWLRQFFVEQNLKRAVATFDHHSGPIYYYIPAVLVGFFPWSVFLGATAILTTRRIRAGDRQRAGCLLAVCWLTVYLVFWSLVQTKLPHYILPAFPALALLTGLFLDRWRTRPDSVRTGWLLNATVTWMVVGVAILIALPLVAARVLPGEGVLGLVGLVLAVGGLGCLILGLRGRTEGLMWGFALTSILFVTAITGYAARRVDRHQNTPALLAEIRRSGPGPVELAGYRFFRESFVFYSGQRVPHCNGPQQLKEFLSHAQRPYVITTDEYEDELTQALPGQLEVIARRPRFLKHGTIVLLTRREVAPSETARRPERRPAASGSDPTERTL